MPSGSSVRNNEIHLPSHNPFSTDWEPPPPPITDPKLLSEHISPQPSVPRWIARGRVDNDLTWNQLDGIRKNAELGLTEYWGDLTRRMLATDSHIYSTYTTYIAAIAGARREVVPAMVDPGNQEIADAQAQLCERMFDSLPNPEKSIGEALDGDFTGWAVLEIMWEPRGEWMWPTELIWVHPDRIRFSLKFEPYLWDRGYAAQRARELGLNEVQDLAGLGLALPQNKYIVHIPRLLPNYPMTSGIFMSCMRPWWVKNQVIKSWLAGAEVAGNPRMIGKILDQADTGAARNALYQAIQNLAAESVGVLGPNAELEIIDPKMGTDNVWSAQIDLQNAEISKAILGSTLNVEVGDTGGNRALGESQMDTTIKPRWNRSANLVGNTFSQSLFKPFLMLNRHLFGGHVFVPKLKLHISEDIPMITDKAVDSGIVRRNDLRRACRLEPFSKEEGGDELIPAAVTPGDASVYATQVDAQQGGEASAPLRPTSRLYASRSQRVATLTKHLLTGKNR